MENIILLEAIKEYEHLSQHLYKIKIGKRKKEVTLTAIFPAKCFHHLIGLHKLKELKSHFKFPELTFKNLKSGKIDSSLICSHYNISEIEYRINMVRFIEDFLVGSNIIIKFDNRKCYSTIKADYVFYKKNENQVTNLFMKKTNSSDNTTIIPVSITKEESMKVQNRQEIWKILSVEKIEKFK